MILIVDASVAAKWVLPEPDSEQAAALRVPDNDLVAPSMIVAEIGNALWKSAQRGDIDATEAAAALTIAVSHFNQFVPLEDLAARATELAIGLRHPIYDCFYLALAIREGATLVTADKRLHAAAHEARVKAKLL